MKTFKVTITETLSKTVEIKANSSREAEQMVMDNWKDSQYILGSEEFTGVDFKAEERERGRDEAR
ncbi:hypothetical protein M2150_001796 [Lachnospiraceae bacterium PM6-15]|uniref:DpnD/PcfM family protein n=1 Tax=Ohessyouella blattaphilus TaxID=2949333 RepID=UPI003E21C429